MDKKQLTQELVKLDDSTNAARILARVIELVFVMKSSKPGQRELLTQVIKDDKLIVTDKRVSRGSGTEVLVKWTLRGRYIYWSLSDLDEHQVQRMPDIKLTDGERIFVEILLKYLLDLKADFIVSDLGL